MARVIHPSEAFESCHGYKADGDLFLWTDGAIGMLSEEQIPRCRRIVIENAAPGPRSFKSVEEALKVETRGRAGGGGGGESTKEIVHKATEKEREVTRKNVLDVFSQCAKKYKGLSVPEFQEKVGECVDKAFPGKGEY